MLAEDDEESIPDIDDFDEENLVVEEDPVSGWDVYSLIVEENAVSGCLVVETW